MAFTRSYNLPANYKSMDVAGLHSLYNSAPEWAKEFVGSRIDPLIADRQNAGSPTTTANSSGGGSGLTDATRTALQAAIDQYKPGGGFGAGVNEALKRSEKKFMAAGLSGLASAGLAGTTQVAGLGTKFAEEVAAPTLANVETERAQRLSQLNTLLAQMEQGAYESGQGRNLQRDLAEMSANAQTAIAGMRSVGVPSYEASPQALPSLFETASPVTPSSNVRPVDFGSGLDKLVDLGLDNTDNSGGYERFGPAELESLARSGTGIQGGTTPAMQEADILRNFPALMLGLR